ncbi:MAG: choline kinase [Candidatus Magasanikbacteria bacterium]|jgi:thiamine kinase-like enzyme|nr:choline kinase [Candidatus Magasanikbacteria bacterium]
MSEQARRQAMELDFWSGPVTAQPLPGGRGIHDFLVADGAGQYRVRIGEDQPEHALFQYNEVAASQAAHDAGLSPALLHHEPGALIFDHLADAKAMDAPVLGQDANLNRLTGLLGQCHLDLPGHLEVPGPMFWVFHLNRRYARIIMQHGGRMAPALTRLMALNDELETAIGAIRPVFCHNGLTAETILDDGQRVWLINWEFGGWNDGLYDLASLAANLDLERQAADELLHRYRRLNDEEPDQASRRRFGAWKCAALIWAALWGGVGEMFANLEIDHAAYSQQRLDMLERHLAEFRTA